MLVKSVKKANRGLTNDDKHVLQGQHLSEYIKKLNAV